MNKTDMHSIDKYDLIIFDFDLTLADTRLTAECAYTSAFAACGAIFDKTYLFEFLCESLEMTYSRISHPTSSFDEFNRVFDEQVHQTIHSTTVLYDDAVSFVKQLHTLGKKLAIVTNKDHESIKIVLDKYSLTDYFGTLICAEDVKHKKPHKEPIVTCLKQMNTLPEKAIYVGDALNDCICAQNANVDFIYVDRYEHKLQLDDSVMKIKSLCEINL